MAKYKHTLAELKQMQAMPLDTKITMSQNRIRDWVEGWNGNVYVSFSGGKDSTVLLHMVRDLYPDIEAVFCNTGLEYPEIQAFVREHDNVTIIRPDKSFKEVLTEYGYPFISKDVSQNLRYARQGSPSAFRNFDGVNKDSTQSLYKTTHYVKYKAMLDLPIKFSDQCCVVMKEGPLNKYRRQTGKYPITGTMASESSRRRAAWFIGGCNVWNDDSPVSKPLSFWTEQDVLQYLVKFNVPYCKIYGDIKLSSENTLYTTGATRTGCVFCGFGCHNDRKPTRFQRLAVTHPKQYNYCMNGGGYDSDGFWKPTDEGLGMSHVMDELNQLYGEHFIDYK